MNQIDVAQTDQKPSTIENNFQAVFSEVSKLDELVNLVRQRLGLVLNPNGAPQVIKEDEDTKVAEVSDLVVKLQDIATSLDNISSVARDILDRLEL